MSLLQTNDFLELEKVILNKELKKLSVVIIVRLINNVLRNSAISLFTRFSETIMASPNDSLQNCTIAQVINIIVLLEAKK